MADLTNTKIKDTYDGVLHASGSSLTLGDGRATTSLDVVFNTVDVSAGGLKEGGVSHSSISATTSVAGHVELATDAETQAATDTTRAVTPSSLLIKKDSTAIVVGDFTGNSRGPSALDVQSGRTAATQVASGTNSVAVGLRNTVSAGGAIGVGYSNTASGNYGSSAFGYNNTSSGFAATTVGNGNTASGFSRSSASGYINTASGDQSSAFGYVNTASGNYSSAFGHSNTASANNSSVFGRNNTASGNYSSALGYNNNASSNYSSAFGYYNTASGSNSSAFGHRAVSSGSGSSTFGYGVNTTVNNTFEAGYWPNNVTRGGAIRADSTGNVSFTIEDSATAPADGGATTGSEAVGNLGRGMFCIHKNGTAVTLYFNNGGTIQSLSLGTLS